MAEKTVEAPVVEVAVPVSAEPVVAQPVIEQKPPAALVPPEPEQIAEPEKIIDAVRMPMAHSVSPIEVPSVLDELEPILPSLDRAHALSTLDSMVAAMGLLPEGAAVETEPLVEPTMETLPEPVAEPIAEPVAEAVAQPVVETVAEVEPPMQGTVLIGVRSVPPAVHSLIRELGPPAVPAAAKPAVVPASQEEKEPWTPPMQAAVAMPALAPKALLGVAPYVLKALPMAKRRMIGPATPKRMAAPRPGRMVRYSPLGGNPLRVAGFRPNIAKTDVQPRFTLPGPMLTPRLVKFSERELTAVFPEAKQYEKRNVPSWILPATLGLAIVFAGYSGVFGFIQRSSADTRPEPEAMTHTTGANAYAQAVEVTGFRVLMDPTKKSEIQYLVVNHSSMHVTDATVFVTLRAAGAKPGQAPLCKFSFAAPDLGPYQSREMTSTIEKVNRPVDVPEWQNLRADVEIR